MPIGVKSARAALTKVTGDDVEIDAAIESFRNAYYSDNGGGGQQGSGAGCQGVQITNESKAPQPDTHDQECGDW